ncbi:hypothetical protein TVAG_108470 [Trichomonas vaginalis G3]|uniref:BACK domain-containing protein n=1 Tax=Trichomonas vaginalis (strain ATCC PRA-98 / G3) TaxID=412133 RepID=A2EQH1_TRIV3|nr:protein ubiquitination [Trichomonas vaginalis G3]EAY05113.1 hypothetical protein TVAG_108470 [Trichomonas vaginalis G3]KAI5551458.1 protein ubiquitination [Trichomonas vaginalis G3]|eukprot:XP_001317336.1 hypothetical protein [Trichomonas vaginalis G3]
MNQALCLSEKIATSYITDKCNRNFSFKCPVKSDQSYELLRQIISQGRISCEITENITKDLFELGYILGNRDLMKPFINSINSNELSLVNVFDVLEISNKFGNINREISYIASHLCDFETSFLISRLSDLELNLVELIFQHPKLKITSEDYILDIITNLCSINEKYLKLFEYTKPEYATTKGIHKFITLIDRIINKTDNFPSIWSFTRKILKQINFPIKIDSNETKTLANKSNTITEETGNNQEKEKSSSSPLKLPNIPLLSKFLPSVNNDNYLCNILRQGKGTITVSSDEEGKAEQINSNDPDSDFYSKNIANSWVRASLDGYVIPSSYTLQSTITDSSMLLKSWKLEGITAQGSHVVLDVHNNDSFDQGEIRTFDLNTQDKFVGFILTQTDYNCDGDYELALNIFDISGFYSDN